MDVLLINPEFAVAEKYSSNHFTVWPPLGLLSLASYLRKDGHSIRILDLASYGGDSYAAMERALSKNPDVVGITSTTPQFENAIGIAKLSKKLSEGSTVVFGGVHATVKWQEVLSEDSVDYVVAGEGEIAFSNLVDALSTGKKPDSPGICFKSGKCLKKLGGQSTVKSLDDLPIPAYDLLNIQIYLDYVKQTEGFEGLAYIASRGCPFECIFCAVNCMMGKKLRQKSPERTVEEIEWLISKHGAEGIWFKDSTFTADRRWVLEFCKEVKERGLDFVWKCNTRVDCVDSELLRAMKGAGLDGIWFGIESGSDRILRVLKKGYTTDQIMRAMSLCEENELAVSSWMIIGSPTEDLQDVRASVRLVRKLKLNNVHWHTLVPLPGSEIYERIGAMAKDYSDLRFNKAVMATGALTKEQVQVLYDQVVCQNVSGELDERKIAL